MGGTTGRARKPNCECRGRPEPRCPRGWLQEGSAFSDTSVDKHQVGFIPCLLPFRRGWFPFSYTRVLDNDGSERVHTR